MLARVHEFVGTVRVVDERDELDTRAIVRRFLDAVESRDLASVAGCLAADVTWQNVPHPVTSGRDEVIEMLARVVTLSERVEWEVVSEAYSGDHAWLERVDRFWIDGECHGVCCNGVVTVDHRRGLVRSFRDYVDLGEWRDRIAPVLRRRAIEPAETTVQRHLGAVRSGDPVAMAADYAADAVLTRGSDAFEGRAAIARYFHTVPDRLGHVELRLSEPSTAAGGSVSVRWELRRPEQHTIEGTDVYEVGAGRIERQTVTLDHGDF